MDIAEEACVWIGVAAVVPRKECELLSPEEGAYINFLTLAKTEAEYRAKISGALDYYGLQLIEFLNVRPFSASHNSSEKIQVIAKELKDGQNLNHVRYSTFHKFPRLM